MPRRDSASFSPRIAGGRGGRSCSFRNTVPFLARAAFSCPKLFQEQALAACTKDIIAMIKLTRLGGEPFLVNADLIRYVEARPDTYVTLSGDEPLVVRESMEDARRRAIDYPQSTNLI